MDGCMNACVHEMAFWFAVTHFRFHLKVFLDRLVFVTVTKCHLEERCLLLFLLVHPALNNSICHQTPIFIISSEVLFLGWFVVLSAIGRAVLCGFHLYIQHRIIPFSVVSRFHHISQDCAFPCCLLSARLLQTL